MAKSRKGRLARLHTEKELGSKEEYEKRVEKLQLRMLRIQQAYFHQKRRAVIVFEGWDAAGKGGTIRRLTEQLDPRGYHVWPVGKPEAAEQGRHYLYRFWQRLPEPGHIAIFDRSWYGRVLVERVEGFCTRDAWKRAYKEINEFERMLTDDGARVIKLFIHITPEEQLKRFKERLTNPYKQWKITEEDIRNRERWADYVDAVEDMFKETDTKNAPWVAVAGNRKWYARTQCMEHVAEHLSRGVDIELPKLDPVLQKKAARALGVTLE